MKYENRKNGSIGTIVEENEKSKTVILELEDGKTVSISTSTLKRWWKKVKEEEAEVVEPLIDLDNPITDEEAKKLGMIDGEKALEMEETAGDGTPLTEVGKEIAEQAKEKAEQFHKSRTSKKREGVLPLEERQRLVVDALKIAGFNTYISDKTPNTVHILDDAGKKTRGVYLGGAKCVLGLPKNEVPDGATADRVRKCKISHSFDIQYNALDKMISLLSKVKKEEN